MGFSCFLVVIKELILFYCFLLYLTIYTELYGEQNDELTIKSNSLFLLKHKNIIFLF